MTPTADQQIDDLINRHEASWRLGYDAFPAVLEQMGLKRGAEIGVAFGGHSEAILQNTCVEKLYAVDSYKHRPEYDDPMNLPQPVFDRLYQRTGERLSAFGERVTQIRLDSVEAAQEINEPLDFVYIDGDHSYEGIRADLEAWFPLIREGGIVAGHDYGQPAFPGVKAAADHFFKRFGLTVKHEGKGVWWAHRPATPATIVIPAKRPRYCDATLYQRLTSAGLTDSDPVILVHSKRNPCDPIIRALAKHPSVQTILTDQTKGPWHTASCVLDQVKTPLIMPIDLDTPFADGAIRTLRTRLCNSGAMASAFAASEPTNDFDLATLLATSNPPKMAGRMIMMTAAVRQAQANMPGLLHKTSEQLAPWLVLMDTLANGGRVTLEPTDIKQQTAGWSAEDCLLAAEALSAYAHLIDGTDLLRLKWPSIASHWLNQLDHKPVRTRANVRPIDTPATHDTPRLLDRVVHKIRRTRRGAA